MYKHLIDTIQNHQPKPLGQKQTYAVLLPLVETEQGLEILYQVRSETIPQPGEISFPGGRVETGETPAQAAIRETSEELNLTSDQVKLLGEIDYIVHQGRTIHCFVGKLATSNWQTIQPNEEVAELFTLPLEDLLHLDPTYYSLKSRLIPDQDFPFDRIRGGKTYPFSDQKRTIPFYDQLPVNLWGLTALFTHHFCQLVRK